MAATSCSSLYEFQVTMIAALVSMKLWSLVNACFAIAINNPISSNRVYNFKSLLYDFELYTEFRFLAGFQYWTRFTADSACHVSLLSSEFKHHVTEELRRCGDKNKQHIQRNILYEAVCMKFTYLHVSSQDESRSGAALSPPTRSVQIEWWWFVSTRWFVRSSFVNEPHAKHHLHSYKIIYWVQYASLMNKNLHTNYYILGFYGTRRECLHFYIFISWQFK